MADNVPAVQALGQCIFLPMLIIGGVAVPLASLPEWAQHVSAFFPGRYAVEATAASVTGSGTRRGAFSMLALLLIGAAGCVAGTDAVPVGRAAAIRERGQRLGAVALAAWMAVGLLAEARGRIGRWHHSDPAPRSRDVPPDATPDGPRQLLPPRRPTAAAAAARPRGRSPQSREAARLRHPKADARSNSAAAAATDVDIGRSEAHAPSASAKAAPDANAARTGPGASTWHDPARSWQQVTMADIDRDLMFSRLPPDSGVVHADRAAQRRADETDSRAARQDASWRCRSWKPGKVDRSRAARAQLSCTSPRCRTSFRCRSSSDIHPARRLSSGIQEDIPKDRPDQDPLSGSRRIRSTATTAPSTNCAARPRQRSRGHGADARPLERLRSQAARPNHWEDHAGIGQSSVGSRRSSVTVGSRQSQSSVRQTINSEQQARTPSTMKKRQLGTTGMDITRVGFGAWAIGGGGWSFAWGAQDDDESLAAMRHAVERGVNWIDTAAVYGLGHSEELVGRLLRDYPRRRSAVRLHQVRAGVGRERSDDAVARASAGPSRSGARSSSR